MGFEGKWVFGNDKNKACVHDRTSKLFGGRFGESGKGMNHACGEQTVIRTIKKLNQENRFCISIMIDREGQCQIYVVDHVALFS